MKKMTALLLVMALTLAMVIPASASEVESEITISGAEILSVQEMSHEEADAMLAELLGANESMVAPRGTSAPSSSSVWDLSVKKYPFTCNTTNTAIYSNYVFSGHNGKVKFNFQISSSSGDGDFILRVFIKNFWTTKVYDAGVARAIYQSVTVDGFDSDDLIYFVIIPDGVSTVLIDGTSLNAAG